MERERWTRAAGTRRGDSPLPRRGEGMSRSAAPMEADAALVGLGAAVAKGARAGGIISGGVDRAAHARISAGGAVRTHHPGAGRAGAVQRAVRVGARGG